MTNKVEAKQTAVQSSSAKPDQHKKEKVVIDEIKGMGVPFVPNQGQLKDENVAYYADLFAGTVFVTHAGQITYRDYRPAGEDHALRI